MYKFSLVFSFVIQQLSIIYADVNPSVTLGNRALDNDRVQYAELNHQARVSRKAVPVLSVDRVGEYV